MIKKLLRPPNTVSAWGNLLGLRYNLRRSVAEAMERKRQGYGCQRKLRLTKRAYSYYTPSKCTYLILWEVGTYHIIAFNLENISALFQ